MVDRCNGGQTGNIAIAIDHRTGQVTPVINCTRLDVVDVERHPHTGVARKTIAVPDRPQVLDCIFSAALVLANIRFQQWDIALPRDGPLVSVVNLFGNRRGCDLSQSLCRRGLLDDTMKSILSQHRL